MSTDQPRPGRRRAHSARRRRIPALTRPYATGLAPTALALGLVLISLHAPANLPGPPPTPVVFDGARATAAANQLRAIPSRSPGSASGDEATATVRRLLETASGDVVRDRFSAPAGGGRRARLENLTVVDRGQSSDTIVVLAPRDAAGAGPGDVASATGVLVELARGLAGLQRQRTLVLASVDGASLGAAGARRLLRTLRPRLRPFAVIALAGVGDPRAPLRLRDRGSGRVRTQAGLTRGLRRAIEQAGGAGTTTEESLDGQLLDLVAPPLPRGEQAPFVDAGVAAVQLGGDGDPLPGARLSARRIGAVGDALLGVLLSLDAGAPPDGPRGPYIALGGRIAGGFVIALAAASLLLAPALEAFVLVGRLRVERLSLAPALASSLRIGLLLTGALVGLWVAGGVGLIPRSPYAPPFDGTGIGLGALALVAVGTSLGAGAIGLLPPPPAPAEDHLARAAAARAAALVAGVGAGAVALAGAPLAAVPALLALHGIALLPQVGRGGRPARVAVVWLPLMVPWLIVAASRGLAPAELARMVADGRLPAATVLGTAAIAAVAAALTASELRRPTLSGPARRREPRVS